MAVRPLPRPRTRAPLLVVRSPVARRRSSVRLVVLMVVTVFAVAALQAFVGQEGMRVSELERQVRRAEERLTLLRARQAQLTEPARLTDEAARLGMVTDAHPTFLRDPAPDPEPDPRREAQASRRLLTPGRP